MYPLASKFPLAFFHCSITEHLYIYNRLFWIILCSIVWSMFIPLCGTTWTDHDAVLQVQWGCHYSCNFSRKADLLQNSWVPVFSVFFDPFLPQLLLNCGLSVLCLSQICLLLLYEPLHLFTFTTTWNACFLSKEWIKIDCSGWLRIKPESLC